MAEDIDALLGEFTETDYTPRLCRAVFKVVPFAPSLPHYASLIEGLKLIEPKANKRVFERAAELLREDGPQKALWMGRALDTADSGISLYSGIAGAVGAYKAEKGQKLDALETDKQQAADAVLKALGLAYMIHKLFPGGAADKVKAFRDLESGRALAFYYAAVEVGLPFADNALVGGGEMIKSLFDRLGDDTVEKFAAVAGEDQAQEAMGLMGKLMAPLEKMVSMSVEFLSPIADAAVSHLPQALNMADKVAGIAATGADALPVYRYLVPRMVVEVCVQQALAEVGLESATAPAVHDASDPVSTPIQYTVTTADKDDLANVPVPVQKKRGCFLRTLFFGSVLAAIGAGAGYFLMGN